MCGKDGYSPSYEQNSILKSKGIWMAYTANFTIFAHHSLNHFFGKRNSVL
jgi:hypothetical protein